MTHAHKPACILVTIVTSTVAASPFGTETTPQTLSYQPSSSPASVDGKKTKTRTSINPQQLEVLMQAYSKEQRPSKQTREDLMARTGLDMKVQLYMCNNYVLICIITRGMYGIKGRAGAIYM